MKNSENESGKLDEPSLRVRRLVLRALSAADKGHVGSALSLIEIMRVLYEHIVKHDPKNPAWPERARVTLSKGHGCLALYAILADQGYFPAELLDTFCERHSPLGGHPEQDIKLGVEASTGSLGHGLPMAVGMALAHQRLGDAVRVFAIVGDGELNEGSNWEVLLTAAKHQLANLTIIVDTSKAGVVHLILSVAAAWGSENINVNCISPEWLLSPRQPRDEHARIA